MGKKEKFWETMLFAYFHMYKNEGRLTNVFCCSVLRIPRKKIVNYIHGCANIIWLFLSRHTNHFLISSFSASLKLLRIWNQWFSLHAQNPKDLVSSDLKVFLKLKKGDAFYRIAAIGKSKKFFSSQSRKKKLTGKVEKNVLQ